MSRPFVLRLVLKQFSHLLFTNPVQLNPTDPVQLIHSIIKAKVAVTSLISWFHGLWLVQEPRTWTLSSTSSTPRRRSAMNYGSSTTSCTSGWPTSASYGKRWAAVNPPAAPGSQTSGCRRSTNSMKRVLTSTTPSWRWSATPPFRSAVSSIRLNCPVIWWVRPTRSPRRPKTTINRPRRRWRRPPSTF